MNQYQYLKNQDQEAYQIIIDEEARQQDGLELIPSENYVSVAVREALYSGFTNKYAEGYPGRRYYGGQDFTDAIERLAIERASKLFGARFANVQPLSGAPANLAVYSALLEPGDTVLGMDLSHGGHLTHGHPVTLPAKIYNFVRYKIKDLTTGEIDYENLRRLAKEYRPKILLAGFSSYSRELDYQKLVEIAREVGAISMLDASHIAGLIAGGALENPFDYGFDLITTTTHKTLRGPRGGMILVRADEEIFKSIQKAVFPGLQGGPHMNNIAAKAVAFGEALTEDFRTYAQQVLLNTKAMEEVFRQEEVEMINGGTDNHLLLIDTVKNFSLSGKESQTKLDEIGITLNMNVIPDDARSPLDPSGIRLGTPALTTRGFKEDDARTLTHLIVSFLRQELTTEQAREKVSLLVKKFPIPEKFI